MNAPTPHLETSVPGRRPDDLCTLIQSHELLRSDGYDDVKHRHIVAGTREELDLLKDDSFGTLARLASGVSGVGTLLACLDHDDKGVPDNAITQVGWLINELGGAIHGLACVIDHIDDVLACDEQVSPGAAQS